MVAVLIALAVLLIDFGRGCYEGGVTGFRGGDPVPQPGPKP